MKPVRIYHIHASEEAHSLIQSYCDSKPFLRLIGHTSFEEQALTEIKRMYPDIVLLDDGIITNRLSQFIQTILLQSPYIGIIITTAEAPHNKLKQWMNAGARDCLIKPFTAVELAQSVSEVFEIMNRQKDYMIQNTMKILTRTPKMLTVFSTKGGVGKSTLATLIGAGLASYYGDDTVIVDLDLQFGDISMLLDVKSGFTITNALEKLTELRTFGVRNFLAKHKTGVYVLPSPVNPEEADFIGEEGLKQLFALLKEEFEHIIVDCPPALTDQVIVTLEQSDWILFITSPELVSLKNTSTGMRTIKELGIPPEKVKLIVNRYTPKSRISPALIQKSLNTPIFDTITEEYNSVLEFANNGTPQLLFESASPINKDLKRLIEKIRNYHYIKPSKGKKRSWWPFRSKS